MFKDITSSKRIEIKPGAVGSIISKEVHDLTHSGGGVMGIRKSLGRKGIIMGANLVPKDYIGNLELQLYNAGVNTVEILEGERVGNLLTIVGDTVYLLPNNQEQQVLFEQLKEITKDFEEGKTIKLQYVHKGSKTIYEITRIPSESKFERFAFTGLKSDGSRESFTSLNLDAILDNIILDITLAEKGEEHEK